MSLPAKPYSLAQAIEGFFGVLPEALVSATQLDLLKGAAQLLPPITRLGIECRLNREQQVDLQLCLRRDEDDLDNLVHWVKEEIKIEAAEQAGLINFFEHWADSSTTYHHYIDEVYLELDVLPSGYQVPLLFFSLEQKLSSSGHKQHYLSMLNNIAGSGRSYYPLLDKIIAACPDGAFVAYLGILFSRDIDVLRVNVKRIPAHEIIYFLQQIGYAYITPELKSWIDWVHNYADRVTLCLDIGAVIYPKVGFECFWNDQLLSITALEKFLEGLTIMGLCEAEKVEAVLNWTQDIFPGDIASWPEHLWVETLHRPEHEFTYLRKLISHIKLSYQPGHQLEAKAYLGFGNLWMKLNTHTVEPN